MENLELLEVLENEIEEKGKNPTFKLNSTMKDRIKEFMGLSNFLYDYMYLNNVNANIIDKKWYEKTNIDNHLKHLISIIKKYPITTEDLTDYRYGYYYALYGILNYLVAEGVDIDDFFTLDELYSI